jgi:hypothetical protein
MRFIILLICVVALLTHRVAAINDTWTKQFGYDASDTGRSICKTSDTIYSVGAIYNSLTSTDGILIRQNFTGNVTWTKTYGSRYRDMFFDVACDESNNAIYAVGYSYGNISNSINAGGADCWIQKYNLDGVPQWSKLIGGAKDDKCKAVTVDASGYVYIAADITSNFSIYTLLGTQNIYVAKLDPQGNIVWDSFYGGEGEDKVGGLSISFDNKYLLVGGSTKSTFFENKIQLTECSFATIFNIASGLKLASRVNPSTTPTNGNDIAFSANSYEYTIAGIVQSYVGGFGNTDIYIARFDFNGKTLWSKQYGSVKNDYAYGITVLPDDSVIVVGTFYYRFIDKVPFTDYQDIFWVWIEADGNMLNYGIAGSNATDYAFGVTSELSTYQAFIVGDTNSNFPDVPKPNGIISNMFIHSAGIYTCPLGFFCAQPFTPIPCPQGTKCNTTGLIAPSDCPQGMYCPTVVQVLPCPIGKLCPVNTSIPISCAAGYYCPWGGLQQLPCNTPGDFCNQTSLGAPLNCSIGFTCPNTTISIPCKLGDLCNITRLTFALDCPSEYYCPSPSIALKCTLGSFCNSTRLTTNQNCSIGYYCPNITSSILCPLGTSCISQRIISPIDCPLGYVCKTPVQLELCPNGTYCPSGSYNATSCNLGQYCNGFSQVDCPAGFVCNTPATKVACSIGTYCPPATVTSLLCPFGFYCPAPSSKFPCNSQCSCPAGSIKNCNVVIISSSSGANSAVDGSSQSTSSSGESKIANVVFVILIVVGSLVLCGVISSTLKKQWNEWKEKQSYKTNMEMMKV